MANKAKRGPGRPKIKKPAAKTARAKSGAAKTRKPRAKKAE